MTPWIQPQIAKETFNGIIEHAYSTDVWGEFMRAIHEKLGSNCIWAILLDIVKELRTDKLPES